jgi:hypothetical protein
MGLSTLENQLVGYISRGKIVQARGSSNVKCGQILPMCPPKSYHQFTLLSVMAVNDGMKICIIISKVGG